LSRWLRRHDPGLLTVRRAGRVTLVACGGFYFCRYGLNNPVMAPYALFGAVALGMLSQIPGSPRQRARTLFAVLPVAWLLITLADLRVWLDGLRDDLTRVTAPAGAPRPMATPGT